jgi:cytoskeleton protein RodZ
MQTIGEKLEEARKRRGISIREASDVTKIRSDYLASFEGNSFSINLPEVYIRGFLRSYAQFLKLNVDKIITDYNAHQLGESSLVRQKESREFLGRMDIPDETGEEPAPAAVPAAPLRQLSPAGVGSDDRGFNYNNFDRSSLIKGGAAIAGAGLLVAVIVFAVLAFLRSAPDGGTLADKISEPTGRQELTLIASGGNIVSITVSELGTDQLLFRGPLNEGERQRVPFNERVRLIYTDAEFLHIEHNGLRYEIPGRGPSRGTFPPNAAR